MPRVRSEPVDLSTQAGRLVWARCYAGYPSSRVAAALKRFPESKYKSHETAERGKTGIHPDTILAYAEAFGVNPAWLNFGKGSPLEGVKPDGEDVTNKAWLRERYEAGPVYKRLRAA